MTQEPLRAGLSLVRRTFGLPAQRFQVKQNNPNSKSRGKSPTHRCGASVHLLLDSVGGRDNRPMVWCQGPSLELAEWGTETSLMHHVCGGKWHQMLQVKESPVKESLKRG